MLKSHIDVGHTVCSPTTHELAGSFAVENHPTEANNTGTQWLSDGQDLFEEAKYRG